MTDSAQLTMTGMLRVLRGVWRGAGVAEYPTIPNFEYEEEITFAANDTQPYVHYEQRTRKKLESGEWAPSHWESGFWRALATNEIEIANAQGGGRVEVLRGMLTPTTDGWNAHLGSVEVRNDPRVVHTTRDIEISGDNMRSTMQMRLATVPGLRLHLTATLTRARE